MMILGYGEVMKLTQSSYVCSISLWLSTHKPLSTLPLKIKKLVQWSWICCVPQYMTTPESLWLMLILRWWLLSTEMYLPSCRNLDSTWVGLWAVWTILNRSDSHSPCFPSFMQLTVILIMPKVSYKSFRFVLIKLKLNYKISVLKIWRRFRKLLELWLKTLLLATLEMITCQVLRFLGVSRMFKCCVNAVLSFLLSGTKSLEPLKYFACRLFIKLFLCLNSY